MDALKPLWIALLINALAWLWIMEIMDRGWLLRIKSLAWRRVVAITATTFALPTTILWMLAVAVKAIWSQMIYPMVQVYAERTGIRKEDA